MEAMEMLSPRAYQLADEYQLGTVRAEYRDKELSWGSVVLFLLIGLGLLCFGYLMLHSVNPFPFPSQSILDWFSYLEQNGYAVMMMIFGGLLLSAGLIGFIYRVKITIQGEKRVYICAKGFVTARTSIVQAVRWEDTKEFLRYIVHKQATTKKQKRELLDNFPQASYIFQSNNGKSHSFPTEPGAIIEYELTTYLLPQTIAKYQGHKTLNFGWLNLNIDGIYLNTTPHDSGQMQKSSLHLPFLLRKQKLGGSSVTTGKNFLPWHELETIWIDESRSTLIISQKNERKHWAVLPLNRVKNVAICLALIERILEDKTYEIA